MSLLQWETWQQDALRRQGQWGLGKTHSLRSSVQSEASPENAARERSRVRTLRQAFLALQATLPAVPPNTKLSKLDVLVLATSYIAHLTRTLGHELPSPPWPPFLRGLRYLHPLKVGLGSGTWVRES